MSSILEPSAVFGVATGTSVQAIADLSRLAASGAAEPPVAAALDAIADPTGETWLHLFGLCLELDEPRSIDQLVEQVGAIDPLHFRRVLLGHTAWSWRSIVGADTIAAAAAGDQKAAARLLADDRYYGRLAAEALATVLPLDAQETRDRYQAALIAYRDVAGVQRWERPLAAVARRVATLAEAQGWVEAVDAFTSYRYTPEPEARRVAVMPHLAGTGLTLAQHDEVRLIVCGVQDPLDVEQRIVELGKALADPARVQILAHVADGAAQLGEIVSATGLTRSTVHHHLRQLRSAGLLAVEGNARAYRYRLSRRGGTDAVAALEALIVPPQEGATT